MGCSVVGLFVGRRVLGIFVGRLVGLVVVGFDEVGLDVGLTVGTDEGIEGVRVGGRLATVAVG